MRNRIKIKELRQITAIIKDSYSIDLDNHIYFSLHRRLENAFQINNIYNTELFIETIKTDSSALDNFIKDICVKETEMFRDPSLWRYLRNTLFSDINNDKYYQNIWIPNTTSGEEFYSLAIVLNEMGLTDNVKIIVTTETEYHLNKIKEGWLASPKDIKLSEYNYKHFHGKKSLGDYVIQKNTNYYIKPELFRNTLFYKYKLFEDNSPKDIGIILYRNKMIYFNKSLQTKVLDYWYEQLISGGYFICGIKEQIERTGIVTKFNIHDSDESIYKK